MKALVSLTSSLGVFTQTYRSLQKSSHPEACVEQLKHEWTQSVFSKLRLNLDVVGEVSKDPGILFVGNHVSYLDIALLLATVPKISFVAKHEISNWPVFGTAAKKIDTVFVKREDGNSRKSARKAVHQALENGKRIAIFPSGTTCITESKPWRYGAFEIAQVQNCFVQPFRLVYSPLRTAAYIDKDFFPTHLYNLSGLESIEAKLEFHPPIKVTSPAEDCHRWQKWSRDILAN